MRTERKTTMNLSDSLRVAKLRARRAAVIRRRIRMTASLIAGLVLILIIAVAVISKKANGRTDRTKQLTSVYVEKGDSIWSIAEQFYTPECGSMKEYVSEIRKTNDLKSDRILYGFTLLVPYYAESTEE